MLIKNFISQMHFLHAENETFLSFSFLAFHLREASTNAPESKAFYSFLLLSRLNHATVTYHVPCRLMLSTIRLSFDGSQRSGILSGLEYPLILLRDKRQPKLHLDLALLPTLSPRIREIQYGRYKSRPCITTLLQTAQKWIPQKIRPVNPFTIMGSY